MTRKTLNALKTEPGLFVESITAEVSGSFHEAAGSILVMAQFFGVMPVIGVKSESASNLRFEWKAWRTIFSLICLSLLIGYLCVAIVALFVKGFGLGTILPVIYHSTAASTFLCFVILAKKWPNLMQNWEAVEAKLPDYRTQKEKSRLKFQITLFAAMLLICGATEDILTTMSTLYYVKSCEPERDLVERFFKWHLEQLFCVTDYALWKGLLGKLIRFLGAFIWNYMNLFVMIVSIGLSSRFKQLNDELKLIKGKPMSENYWKLRRIQYRALSQLCAQIDDAIAPITFIAVADNLFYVCIQLMMSLLPKVSLVDSIYFWFSLIFLLCRTMAILLCASAVHDESKKPIGILRAVPRYAWFTEIERFVEQVVNDRISLSGMRFFYLSRKLILTVSMCIIAMGTIITYELVLMQFQTNKNELLCHSRH